MIQHNSLFTPSIQVWVKNPSDQDIGVGEESHRSRHRCRIPSIQARVKNPFNPGVAEESEPSMHR